jgi:hypothetical protein
MRTEQFYWASKYGAALNKHSFAAIGFYNLTAGKMLEIIDDWNLSSEVNALGIRYALDRESLCK